MCDPVNLPSSETRTVNGCECEQCRFNQLFAKQSCQNPNRSAAMDAAGELQPSEQPQPASRTRRGDNLSLQQQRELEAKVKARLPEAPSASPASAGAPALHDQMLVDDLKLHATEPTALGSACRAALSAQAAYRAAQHTLREQEAVLRGFEKRERESLITAAARKDDLKTVTSDLQRVCKSLAVSQAKAAADSADYEKVHAILADRIKELETTVERQKNAMLFYRGRISFTVLQP